LGFEQVSCDNGILRYRTSSTCSRPDHVQV